MEGFTNGKFYPDAALTREQLAVILTRAYKLPMKYYTDRFSDVDDRRWSYDYIATVAYHNLMVGFEDGTFGPGLPVIREQMAKVVCMLIGAE